MLAQGISSKDEVTIAWGLVRTCALHIPLLKPRGTRGGKAGKRALSRRFRSFDKIFNDIQADVRPDQLRHALDDRPDPPPSPLRDPDSARADAARNLVWRGFVGRAARTIRQEPHFPMTPDRKELLFSKFPRSQESADDLPAFFDDDDDNPIPPTLPWILADMDRFTRLLRASANGSRGGTTGLTGNHLIDCFDDEAIVSDLYKIFSALIDGELPSWTHPYLVATKLHASARSADHSVSLTFL